VWFIRNVVAPIGFIAALIWLTYSVVGLYERYTISQAAVVRADQERKATAVAVLRNFITTVIRDVPRSYLNRDLADAELGQQAIQGYAKFIEGLAGPPPPPPPPPSPEWKLKGCKLEPVTRSIRVGRGEVSLGDINVCGVGATAVAVAVCIGVTLKKCPNDQDMRCVEDVLKLKCVYF
jgi:hypothetical protein